MSFSDISFCNPSESRLKACTGPHGRWHKAVQDRPPPWFPLPKRPQLPQFAASWLLTCRTGIHPTVAEFEPEWLGGQTGGWDASRGTVHSIGFFPGPNGYLGVTIWPWVSPMPTWPVVNPQGPGFSTNNIEREEAATEPGAPYLGTSQSLDMMHQARAKKQQQLYIPTSQI